MAWLGTIILDLSILALKYWISIKQHLIANWLNSFLVETSDNTNGETETSETNGHKVEDEAKAENVSSTEQSAGEAKSKDNAEGKEADETKTEEAQKKVILKTK